MVIQDEAGTYVSVEVNVFAKYVYYLNVDERFFSLIPVSGAIPYYGSINEISLFTPTQEDPTNVLIDFSKKGNPFYRTARKTDFV